MSVRPRLDFYSQLAWLPVVAMGLAIGILWLLGSGRAYESATLLLICNFVFITLISVLIALLAGRTFLITGHPSQVMLCSGMIIWGASSLLASLPGNAQNHNVTIYNLGLLVSAGCHLAGTAVAFRATRPASQGAGGALSLAIAASLVCVGIIRAASHQHLLPEFFIPGTGGTATRTTVLAISAVLFTLAAILAWFNHLKTRSSFHRWYALGLALLSLGIFGVMGLRVLGSDLSWTSRGAQYLGGVYMLIGVIYAVREARSFQLPVAAALEQSQAALRETEQSLRKSRKLLEQQAELLDLSRDAIIVRSTDGTIQSWNGGAAQMYAWSREEAQGKLTHRLLQTVFPLPLAEIEAQLSRDGFWQGVLRHKKRDGSEVIIDSRWTLHAGDPAQAPVVLEINSDITERTHAEQARDLAMRQIEEAQRLAHIGTWQWSAATDAVTGSPEFLRIFGFDPSQKFPNFRDQRGRCFPVEDWELLHAARQHALQTGEGYEMDLRAIHSDGRQIWITTRSQVIRDAQGHTVGLRGTVQDITQRKEAVHALELARHTAEKANLAKDKFLAVLSHELRTPLTPVLMIVAALENNPDVDPAIREEILTIRRNVEIEARLIDDLLDLSRISTGKLRLNLETVEVRAAVRQVCETCRPLMIEKGIRFLCDSSGPKIFVNADPARLQQMLWNLLRNAVKFTPERGEIEMAVTTSADRVRIQVRDTGIGIAPVILPRIFDAFQQGDEGITKKFGGMGLGLAISKALVDMHGGTIQAISDGPGSGATFIVELPLLAMDTPQRNPSPTDHQKAGRPLTILIAEDHRDTAVTLTRLLRRSGHAVKSAGTVTEALELAKTERFDLLVSDIGLPDASGYDLMLELRKLYPIKGIAMSGFGMEEDVRRAQEAGFYRHLTKPIALDQLTQTIDELHPNFQQ